MKDPRWSLSAVFVFLQWQLQCLDSLENCRLVYLVLPYFFERSQPYVHTKQSFKRGCHAEYLPISCIRRTFLPQNWTSKEGVCLIHEYEFPLFS